MAAKYWLKIYYEMLDDPKIGQLRPALRWRFIECLLVAGECDDGGYIPDSAGYAWRVRADADVVDTELTELAQHGLLSRVDGRWHVTKFEERQSPVSNAERQSRWRERQHRAEYYGDETNLLPSSNEHVTKRNTDKIRIDKIREDKNTPPPSARITHQELPPEAQPNFDRADLRRRVSNAIVKLAAETIVPATDKWLMVEDYADEWIDMGVTEEDIPGFRAYWDGLTDRPYNGAPYLKSIGSHFKAYWQSRTVRATGGVNPDGSIGRVNWEALHG